MERGSGYEETARMVRGRFSFIQTHAGVGLRSEPLIQNRIRGFIVVSGWKDEERILLTGLGCGAGRRPVIGDLELEAIAWTFPV